MGRLEEDSHYFQFDFSEWLLLARSDPSEFERKRSKTLEDFFAKVDSHSRLHCLQWRIDMARRKYHHPLVSCMHLYNMMWESVYEDNGLLDTMLQLTEPGLIAASPKKSVKSAKIYPFPTLKG